MARKDPMMDVYMKTPEPTPDEIKPVDELASFAGWYLKTYGPVPASQFDGVHFVGKFGVLTMYREAPYQVQMVLCRPNSNIPQHRHPKTDSLLVMVAGELYLKVNGEYVFPPGCFEALPDGRCNKNFQFIRVPPGTEHGGKIGSKGACFVNFERWLDGKPTSAELDWEGPALSEDHKNQLAKQNEQSNS